jgi:hypothetical protein
MTEFLFDSRGNWIAFRREQDRFGFDANGGWIGWLQWEDNDVVDTNGSTSARSSPDSQR